MPHKLNLIWFRQDLRLSDNPALYHASQQGNILPVYILDDVHSQKHKMGAASRFWLHHSLISLNQSLNNTLSLYKGDPLYVLFKLIKQYHIKEIFWNRCYEPWRIKRDKDIKSKLENHGIKVYSYNASLLWEPWEIKKSDGNPYKVFTPFYRKGCLNAPPPRKPFPKPKKIQTFKDHHYTINLEDLSLLPKTRWDHKLESYWSIGEKHAHSCLSSFYQKGIKDYKEGRNFPAKANVSKLSPYLHFGEISPNQIWYKAQIFACNENIDHFFSELGWREFSYNLLYFNPDLPTKNLKTKFDQFPWNTDLKNLTAWQKGKTGIPIVDAGMRELWQTGYIHNRVRMIASSFLVKNLRIDWHQGEGWFWDCLVDADLANNSTNWQWIAGCGADAVPYFRIFNPVIQGQKFDPEGIYTKKFIPELKALPVPYLFNPWEASDSSLEKADIILGKIYPRPVIDLKQSRQEALHALQTLKQNNARDSYPK